MQLNRGLVQLREAMLQKTIKQAKNRQEKKRVQGQKEDAQNIAPRTMNSRCKRINPSQRPIGYKKQNLQLWKK